MSTENSSIGRSIRFRTKKARISRPAQEETNILDCSWTVPLLDLLKQRRLVLSQKPNGSAERFAAYLHTFADHDPNFQIVDPVVVAWPDRLYVDGIHFDAEGATLFSRAFNACEARLIEQNGAAIDCDLSWQAARTAPGATGQ
jgi:hypothetical protein